MAQSIPGAHTKHYARSDITTWTPDCIYDVRLTMRTKKPLKTHLLANPTPGEILLEEFLKPMGLSQNALARAINVPTRRINEIVLGKRSVTADTDLRFARYFGLSEGFFLGLQVDHDLMARKREIGSELRAIATRAA